jgi:hypothetical protein
MTAILSFDQAEAIAAQLRKRDRILYRHPASPRGDRSLLLKDFKALGHAGAAHAKQLSQHHMGERHLVSAECIAGDEQPADKSLPDTVIGIAGARLRSLHQNRGQISLDDRTQVRQIFEKSREIICPDPQRFAAHLDRPAVKRHRLGRKQDRRADESLRSDQPDLDEFFAADARSDRHEAAFDEVDVLHRQPVVMQDLMRSQLNALASSGNAGQFVGGN